MIPADIWWFLQRLIRLRWFLILIYSHSDWLGSANSLFSLLWLSFIFFSFYYKVASQIVHRFWWQAFVIIRLISYLKLMLHWFVSLLITNIALESFSIETVIALGIRNDFSQFVVAKVRLFRFWSLMLLSILVNFLSILEMLVLFIYFLFELLIDFNRYVRTFANVEISWVFSLVRFLLNLSEFLRLVVDVLGHLVLRL